MMSTLTSHKQPSDRLLFLRLKNKDQAAFMRAYEAYRAGIYRFIYFRVNSEAEAQDLTSSVFLKVWSVVQAGKLKDYRSLRSLLYTVARHTVIDYYREGSGGNVSLDDETAEIEVVDNRLDIQALMEQDSDLKLIYEALDQLKPEYREVIMLHFVSELSVKEIAEVIDKKPGNVRVILHRGLEALRKLTKEEEEIKQEDTITI
ncbi:RNA polymerase sigma factor [Patescibacteria group bacterium]|nr:RNA polymerase sigma factor [Patescibacteria group bacterium]HRU90246.1 RNA polymerase sigma factor [Patescibacteria group bacterium]